MTGSRISEYPFVVCATRNQIFHAPHAVAHWDGGQVIQRGAFDFHARRRTCTSSPNHVKHAPQAFHQQHILETKQWLVNSSEHLQRPSLFAHFDEVQKLVPTRGVGGQSILAHWHTNAKRIFSDV